MCNCATCCKSVELFSVATMVRQSLHQLVLNGGQLDLGRYEFRQEVFSFEWQTRLGVSRNEARWQIFVS